MGFSNHRHVVGAITYCKCHNFGVIFLNEPDDICFLAWRDPTANNRLTSLRDLKELFFEQVVFKDDSKSLCFYKDAHHLFFFDSLGVFTHHFIRAELFYAIIV